MPRLSIDLDEATFRAFSVKCAELGLKETQVVQKLIKKWLEERAEKEKEHDRHKEYSGEGYSGEWYYLSWPWPYPSAPDEGT